MKRLALFVLLLASSVLAFATIYSYTAKDGKVYYTNERPTGLTAAERAQYKAVTATRVDAITPTTLSNRNAVRTIQRADNAPPPPAVIPQQPPATTGTIAPPKVAVICNGDGQDCVIPAGVTAKVWRGTGGQTGKWAIKTNMTGSFKCTNEAVGDPQTGNYNRCFYVDTRLLAKDLDPKGANLMPVVNKALVPTPAFGLSAPMLRPATIPRLQSMPSAGAFRIACRISHMNFDDPIVFPGVKDATHHHTFFGNTKTDAFSTHDSLRATGNSTCAGGILNRSGYWMPSLINTSTRAPVVAGGIIVYYKGSTEHHPEHITAPPANLRMIAGNARPLAVADTRAEYFCQDLLNNRAETNWGILWQASHIKPCGGQGKMLRMIVGFPQCWDGKNLDSPDHQSHMAYSCGTECLKADGKIGATFNGCPVTHPVLIPDIALNVDYHNLDPNVEYRLSSDNYSKAHPGGYSLHADWMNAWDEGTINRLVKNCLNTPRDCGMHNLGDGQELFGID